MQKTVVITGSTRGIGFGLALRFLEHGCNVVLNGTSPESTSKAITRLQRYSEHVTGVPADISTPEGITQLYDEALLHFGSVDIWINNAGIVNKMRSTWELDHGSISRIFDVNIEGIVYGTIIPYQRMATQGGGKIFNMEGLGSDGYMQDGMTIYGTTKSALTYFTRSFAHEARGSSVQVGTLSPGMVVTDMLRSTINEGSEDSLKKKRFFNIMADDVETVSDFLCRKILSSTAQSPRIKWLTKAGMIRKMLLAPFRKRDFFS
jgi:NAD(P)-dependent dehydrogenase (short-subunit alcohol dehydrogenase family)